MYQGRVPSTGQAEGSRAEHSSVRRLTARSTSSMPNRNKEDPREVKLPNLKKKYVAGALAVGLIMGAGGIAAAYFTATGTGTGKVSVGSATPFTVTQNSSPSGTLYPGQSVTTAFTITNTGGGIQHYTLTSTDIVPAMNATGTVITANTKTGNAVPGCKASWFTTTILGGGGPHTLNPNASTTASVRVNMTNGTGSGTQNACQTTFPKLDVAFGGPAGFGLFEADGGTASWTNSKSTATLTIPANSPYGAAAGILVLKPGSTLPTKMPTFTTTTYNAGSGTPRWVIFFTTGKHVFGYPSTAGSVANLWTGSTLPALYNTWTAVKTADGTKTVSQVFIVMTIGQTIKRTSTQADLITTVTYGGQHF